MIHIPDITAYFPITNPTWIFFLVLCVILFAPMLLGRLRIPHIIGMILAGVLLGKYGLNILERDSSFELFGRVGLYYIMFLAGLEMDLEGFNKNRNKAFLFGVLTTSIPFVMGLLSGIYLLDFGVATSALLSCIFASHTLVAYPIVSRYGLNKHPIVSVSIGGTLFALTVSLMILAAISGICRGNANSSFWVLFCVKCTAYIAFSIFTIPRLARWFFRRFEDNVMQYIFVLSMVFLSAALAELAGLEGLFGAFLAGLLLNRQIPHVSPLMNRIEFVGNALFIPYFLIGVGMLINLRALFNGGDTLVVVLFMIGIATLSKWIAAFATQKLCGVGALERNMMFGLSNAHAAGALAMVMVGTNIELEPGKFLMNEDMLNGVVIMILFSCIVSSMFTEMASRKMTLVEENNDDAGEHFKGEEEKMLVTLSNPETVASLMDIALMMRKPKSKKELLALTVAYDNGANPRSQVQGKTNLEKATRIAAAADVSVRAQYRLSTNVVTGILHTMNERDATEVVMGLHHKANLVDSFFGKLTTGLQNGTFRQLMIVKCLIPVNTMRRVVVAVPPKAEYEAGFYKWLERLCRLGGQLGCRVHFCAHPDTWRRINGYIYTYHRDVRTEYSVLDDWDDLLLLTGLVNYDHLLVVVSARRGSISYQSSFEHLPEQIMKYFSNNSLMLIYPDQYGDPQDIITFSEPPRSESGIYKILERYFNKWNKRT